jgi:zinc transport system substrate-binding protein
MKQTIRVIIACFLVLVLGTGIFYRLKQTSTQTSDNTIVASFYPMYFFTKEIAGDKFTVINMTPNGTEPHDYEPTTQDLRNLETAKLIVTNGGVEVWQNKLTPEEKVKTVVASEGMLTNTIEEDGKQEIDPHVWLDPILAKTEVQRIADGIIKADPARSAYYQANTKRLLAELDSLNKSYKTGLSMCMKKDIVTSHAAFYYLGHQYGLNQVAIAGLSPDEEPSAQRLGELTDFVHENNVSVIFFEELASPKLSETLAQETGVQTMVLSPLEGLSPDEEKQGEDYISKMTDNLHALQTALSCR